MTKRDKTFIIFLFIVVSNLFETYCQNISLKIVTENREQDSIADIYFRRREFENYESLKNSIEDTKKELEKSGYYSYTIIHPIKVNNSLCTLYFNSAIKTKNILIYYNDKNVESYLDKLKIKHDSQHFNLKPDQLESTLTKFSSNDSERGYATTVFKLENIVQQKNILKAQLHISRKNKQFFTNVEIRGYSKFPKSFLSRYFKNSFTLNKSQLSEKIEAFYSLPFLNKIKEPEILLRKDTATVYLYTEKKNANRFEGFLGFRNSSSNSNIKLDGNLELNLLNNLNYGESIDFLYKSDGNDQQNLNLKTRIPYLFNSNLGIGASIYLFRKDSTFSTINQNLFIDYELSFKNKIALLGSFEKSTLLADSNEEGSNYSKDKISIAFNHAQTEINTFKSIPFQLNIAISALNRKTKNSPQNATQYQIEFDFSYLFELSKEHFIYFGNNFNILKSESYFKNELLRLGGNKSIRGFRENQLLANGYFLANTEYRYIPNSTIYFHTITDAAYIENKNQGLSEYLYSLGLGMGLQTKAGILNISLANGIQPSEKFKFSKSILHIAFTTQF